MVSVKITSLLKLWELHPHGDDDKHVVKVSERSFKRTMLTVG